MYLAIFRIKNMKKKMESIHFDKLMHARNNHCLFDGSSCLFEWNTYFKMHL